MGENRLVRRNPFVADGDQERAVEPAAVLVAAFKVEVCRIAEFGPLFEHSGPGGAGIKPDVENIRFLAPVLASAVRAFEAFGDDVLEVGLEPVVASRGMFGEAVADFTHPFGIVPGLAAVLADEGDDGHAPLALTGNAPVRTGCDHVVDTLAAPGGNPGYLVVNGVQGFPAEIVLFHADEPLGGGAENERLLAAPAARIGVRDVPAVHERAGFLQLFEHGFVGVENIHAREKRNGRQEDSGVVHG